MAAMGIAFLQFLLLLIIGTVFLSLVFFIVSIILFLLNKKAKKEGREPKRFIPVITLIISIIFLFPLILAILTTSVSSHIINKKEAAFIESIENKVYVKQDEWENGFEYNDKYLVPVNIFINSDSYAVFDHTTNLTYIGALVIENTTTCYYIYEIDNDSGYKIYYVRLAYFVNEEYSSRFFVAKNDYESVLNYYSTSDLEISATWIPSSPDNETNYESQILDLDIADIRDELMELSHEVLDDVSDKEAEYALIKVYDSNIDIWLQSKDRVFTIDLDIYTKQDEIQVYLNRYKVEDDIINKHKPMLLQLINDVQQELEKNK